MNNTMTASVAPRPLIEIEGLTIGTRRGTRIVKNVSFTLERGKVLGLIGESGAGKSTLGLSALGYVRPGCRVERGRIRFAGREIQSLAEKDIRLLRGRKVTYIAQSAAQSFNPSLRLIEQICEIPVVSAMMSGEEARHRAIGLFRELELPAPESFGERYPHQVSGGQLQRAMAAMAMITSPDVVVFDEPTTALDVTTQVGVLASFRELIRGHGAAALYITHDLAVVAQMADELMVMRHGATVEHGTTAQILDAPCEDYTSRLVNQRRQAATRGPAAPRPGDNAPVLSLSNLTAGYGALTAVSDVTFDVARGETVAVVGESGSGKSSLARAIVGLLPARSGGVEFRSERLPTKLRARNRDQLRRLQIVYQSPDVALNPRHTVLQIIGRPIGFFFKVGQAEVLRRVKALLKDIELDDSFLTRRPGELSGGQKQRICIARALAAEPDLIICDEVTSALDPLVAAEILDLLGRLQRQRGIAYLFITHDMEAVRKVADRVAIMLRGKVIRLGDTGQVFEPPFDPYTETLIASIPEMRTDWLDGVLARNSKIP
jgi:peptide/nickel transport system ATP-binding protein